VCESSGRGNDFGATLQLEQQDSQWMTSAEAAAYLKVQTRSLLLWVRKGN
jgi:hypothetical protein